MRLLLPIGPVMVIVIILASTGTIGSVRMFVAIGTYLAGRIGLLAWVSVIMQRARRRSVD
jgi:hypothetical protein